ncbi:hypothetical protein TERTU_1679 [Teredinibacter turnerae T7901]|uniref:Uncharacterized protein n=1 Tax=Teredinibacter turnerae (strain ATCC 39867 / T7901) TaxID=377629 RepID=C5BU22_TERTT|nr:hypothetical protein TERTU_1679 [Teredinibacter turnerae T7901]
MKVKTPAYCLALIAPYFRSHNLPAHLLMCGLIVIQTISI